MAGKSNFALAGSVQLASSSPKTETQLEAAIQFYKANLQRFGAAVDAAETSADYLFGPTPRNSACEKEEAASCFVEDLNRCNITMSSLLDRIENALSRR